MAEIKENGDINNQFLPPGVYRRRSSSAHLDSAQKFLENRERLVNTYKKGRRKKSRVGLLVPKYSESHENGMYGPAKGFYTGNQTVYSIETDPQKKAHFQDNCFLQKNRGSGIIQSDMGGSNHKKSFPGSRADNKRSISSLWKLYLAHGNVIKESKSMENQAMQILPPIKYSSNSHPTIKTREQTDKWKSEPEGAPMTAENIHGNKETKSVEKVTLDGYKKFTTITGNEQSKSGVLPDPGPTVPLISDKANPLRVLPDINMSNTEKTLNSAVEFAGKSENTRTAGLGLVVASASTLDPSDMPTREMSKAAIRREYSKNLEQNWYRSFLVKNKERSSITDKFDIQLDFFYSPEPESAEDSGEENDKQSDKASVVSEYNAESKSPQSPIVNNGNNVPSQVHEENKLKHFSSTNVLTGEDGELDRATPSEIEIVMKNNILIEKHTKHKMRKKRNRKQKLYKNLNSDKNTKDVPVLTDTELRALRLGLKKKQSKLIGRQKFRQVVNVVILANHFTKMLSKLRQKKKKQKEKRKSRKRLVKHEQESVRVATPPTLAERFMVEIGTKLLSDIENLNLPTYSKDEPVQVGETVSLSAVATDDNGEFHMDSASLTKDHSLRVRRLSEPGPIRTGEFIIELSEKPKRRRRNKGKTDNKQRRRQLSRSRSSAVQCACNKNEMSVREARLSSTCNQHTRVGSIAKNNTVIFRRDEVLKRRLSLNENDIKFGKEIELTDLLQNVNMPAKDIRIQIIKRKMMKQKKRKKRVVIPPIAQRPPEADQIKTGNDDKEETLVHDCEEKSCTSETDVYREESVLVSAGISWNKGYGKCRPVCKWTEEEIEKEVKRVSKLFLEMKDCTYIRWTSLHQAMIQMINKTEFAYLYA